MITPAVAQANGTTGVTTLQITVTGVAIGDLIVVDAMIPAGRTLTLTDDRDNDYFLIPGTTTLLPDSSRSIAKYFAIAGAAGDTVITYSIDGTGTRIGFTAQKAASDVGWGSNPVEDVAAATTTPAATASSSGNATSAGEAWYHGGLVGVVQLDATLVGGSGYGDLVQNAPGRIATAHKVVGSGTTDDFELNHTSQVTGIVLVVFREDAGGGGTPVEVDLPPATLRLVAGPGLGAVEEGEPVEVNLPVATLVLGAQAVSAEVEEPLAPVEVDLPVATLRLVAPAVTSRIPDVAEGGGARLWLGVGVGL